MGMGWWHGEAHRGAIVASVGRRRFAGLSSIKREAGRALCLSEVKGKADT
jgi:hypothetical protein